MMRLFLLATLAVAATPACDTPPPETTVGPDGGTVISRDGRLRIDVPRGALAREVELTIDQREDCYGVGPHGLRFSVPAHITLDAPVDHHWSVLALEHDEPLCGYAG